MTDLSSISGPEAPDSSYLSFNKYVSNASYMPGFGPYPKNKEEEVGKYLTEKDGEP